MIRVGQGFDVHAFGDGDSIVLGGERIPHGQGLKAHSDGDVLLHALADALLGAAALGDIGHFFPDSDPRWAGADSRVMLREVFRAVQQLGYSLGNVDLTIIAQAPRMAPYLPAMRENIAADLALAPDAVGLKATTTEHLGFTGRKEGIACMAVCLLVKGETV